VNTTDHPIALFGETEGFIFVAHAADRYVTDTGKVAHHDFSEASYSYPRELDRLVADVDRWVAAAHDVWFTPSLSGNPLRESTKRKKLPVSALWADLDDTKHVDRVQALVEGGAWLVASGGKDRRHLYLPLTEPVPADQAENLIYRLAIYLDADPAPTWHGCYLRPTGTSNHKAPTLGTGPAAAVEVLEAPSASRWPVQMLDDLLPAAERHIVTYVLPDAEPLDDLNSVVHGEVKRVLDEPVTVGMDRSERVYAAVADLRDLGLSDGQVLTAMRQHPPAVDRQRDGTNLERDVARCLAKLAPTLQLAERYERYAPEEDGSYVDRRGLVRQADGRVHDARDNALEEYGVDHLPCTLDECHMVFRRWLGDEYDLDALDAVLATAAAERLAGDPLWLLLISGSGNAKTETVTSLTGCNAHVVSTISSEGAFLSGTPAKQKAKDATGGLLRQLGDRGLLVIKDVTSILSMHRDTRATVLAAIREIHDGHWVRYLGTDGGRTLAWTGRLGIIGATTTAWDRAHDVIASMGDRFLVVRMDSATHTVRESAGRQARHNVGHENQMRTELAAAVGGILATANLTAIEVTDEEGDRLQAAADLVTLARTGVDYDYRGDVIDSHDPEMPTRFMKQLVQLVRGAVAIGHERDRALRLAIRCARDSMPPLRLAILDDIAEHPASTATEVRRRLDKPRATVDRQLQSLNILGVLRCDEETRDTGKTWWRYTLADGIEPATLKAVPDLSVHTHKHTEKKDEKKSDNETLRSTTDISGTAPSLLDGPDHHDSEPTCVACAVFGDWNGTCPHDD